MGDELLHGVNGYVEVYTPVVGLREEGYLHNEAREVWEARDDQRASQQRGVASSDRRVRRCEGNGGDGRWQWRGQLLWGSAAAGGRVPVF